MGAETAYLSIMQWPPGWSVDDRVRALLAAAGIDPFLARQRAGGATPLIVNWIEPPNHPLHEFYVCWVRFLSLSGQSGHN